MDNDPAPPDFVPQLITDNLVRLDCGEPINDPFNEHEKRLVVAKLETYYEANWSSVIMAIMQFKNPLVANAHTLTSLSTQVD